MGSVFISLVILSILFTIMDTAIKFNKTKDEDEILHILSIGLFRLCVVIGLFSIFDKVYSIYLLVF